MDKDNYIATGAFAKMMGVSKDTLFHYEKIGLFKPQIIMKNEYRYYSVFQIDVFNTIKILKELGMSLKEIKEFLEIRNPQNFADLYECKEKSIEEQIKHLRRQQLWMRKRKEEIREILSMDLDQIYIEELETYYYIYGQMKENTDSAFYRKTNELISEYVKENEEPYYEIGYLQNAVDIKNGIYNNYTNTILITKKKPRGIEYKKLKKGSYLVAYFKGHWKNIGAAYKKMLRYAEEKKISIGDEFIEKYMIDGQMVEDIEEQITKIFVIIN